MITTFFKDITPHKYDLTPTWQYDSVRDQLNIHLPSFYNRWPSPQGRRIDLLNAFREQPYFVGDNMPRKVHGKPVFSLVLDYSCLPNEIKGFFKDL